MYVSPAKAIKLYDVSKPTLYADMKKGKLSFEISDRNRRKINVAELDRLYDKRESEVLETEKKTVNTKHRLTESNGSSRKLHQDLEDARKSLADSRKREIEGLKNQIEQQQEQIDHLNKNLNKALDITALLEDKREGQGEQQDRELSSLKTANETLTKQVEQLLNKEAERERERMEHRRKAKEAAQEKKRLEENQKQQGFFKKLFG